MKKMLRSALAFTVCVGIAGLIAAGPTDRASDKAPAKAATAKIGEKAPAWELKDLDGKMHKLSDLKGKVVVLEWFNHGCPACVGVYNNGTVKRTYDAMKKMGDNYVYIAVNSTSNMPEERVAEGSRKMIAKHKMKIPVLMDYGGKIGKTYGAKTTPHMYVIDAEGTLRYQGAFTDDPRGTKGDEGTNYVLNALAQMAAGETVAPDQVKSWGCGVKYPRKAKGS